MKGEERGREGAGVRTLGLIAPQSVLSRASSHSCALVLLFSPRANHMMTSMLQVLINQEQQHRVTRGERIEDHTRRPNERSLARKLSSSSPKTFHTSHYRFLQSCTCKCLVKFSDFACYRVTACSLNFQEFTVSTTRTASSNEFQTKPNCNENKR